jgi:primosomal protein N' (replication factor Y) (superfamily II helicase)
VTHTVEVAVALPVAGTYSYTVPDELRGRVGVGSRVVVPFGARSVTGVVVALPAHSNREDLRPLGALAGEDRLPETLLFTLRWIADYYASSWGETLKAALPPTLRRPPKRSRAEPRAPAVVAASLPPEATPAQTAVVDRIAAALRAGAYQSFLLHGVTGSGKSEVYLRAAEAALACGRTVLVLVPEIALTPQLGERFAARFGHEVAVLHSGLPPGRRAAEWLRLRRGEARIALGARSAVFAPLDGVGLVVVDEEHDASYKQQEGVRYHARDAALVRARAESAVAILGSATPSLDSFQRAREGRHTMLCLPDRVTARPLAEVEVVDLREQRPGLLTPRLREALRATVAAGRQAILLVNRRGFATSLICAGCGHAAKCRDCSVGLVWHRARRVLLCHWCGRAERMPPLCPACGEHPLETLGFGTERLEDTVRGELPGARVARLDSDTAGENAGTLKDVRAGRIDVLVGSQMVAKGHDFPGVTLVGIVLADMGLQLPDFRAGERVFQMLTQAAGRAGRGDDPGLVIIQTYAPEHPAIACAARQDYAGFFAVEARARAELGYPPFGHLVLVRLEGRSDSVVSRRATELADRLARQGVQVLGPSPAPVARARGLMRWQLCLKAPRRDALRGLLPDLRAQLALPGVRVRLDVDPLSLV